MTLATFTDILLVCAIAGGGLGAWRLNRRLRAFKSLLPELRREIERLDSAIAVAQRALADLRHEVGRVDPQSLGRPGQASKPRSAIRNLMAAMKREAA